MTFFFEFVDDSDNEAEADEGARRQDEHQDVGRLRQAYVPDIYETLGLFIPLIVVNCIVLGRAEAFASKNPVWPSLLDGLGMGLGFTLALTLLGCIREFLGSGSIFGLTILPETANILVFILPPGAFICLGFVIAIVNKLKKESH